MKKFTLSVLSIVPVLFVSFPALAVDLMVPAAMQRCNTNEDCAMISNTCSDSCASAPVNKASLPALEQQYNSRCGKTLESQPKCTMNPPLNSPCINSRCTVDYAFANHAGPADYKSGAYPVPEAPVPSKVDPSKAPANDRGGFTAYDMQGQAVKENTLGEIKTTIYVPPQAPVSGGNYVTLGTPTAQTAAPVPPSVPAPAAPVPVAPAPMTAPAPTPAPGMPPAPQANAEPYATPRSPNTYIPAKPEFAPPAEPQTVVDPAVPATAAQPPKLPVMPPQPAPITASDAETKRLAPPAGETVHAGPNDPGAVPPNAELLAPVPEALGEDGDSINKSFSAEKKKSDIDLN